MMLIKPTLLNSNYQLDWVRRKSYRNAARAMKPNMVMPPKIGSSVVMMRRASFLRSTEVIELRLTLNRLTPALADSRILN
ncbi:hypothetical protein [Rhizobium sp.]|uniref:hypothetical protein n=1 Tax=Rhizobium sp. TaxID=391 RepID=UPI0034C609FC